MRNAMPMLPLALLAACAAPQLPSPSPGGPAAFPQNLRALGTEPFWSVEITASRAVWSSPEELKGRAGTIERSEAGGVLRLSGTIGADALIVTITRGDCSDGMSDTIYPFSAKVRFGDRQLTGCACGKDG